MLAIKVSYLVVAAYLLHRSDSIKPHRSGNSLGKMLKRTKTRQHPPPHSIIDAGTGLA
jgi:hypothetical protein